MAKFSLNGKPIETDASEDTPLLWVIRDEFGLTGTKFGCGAGMCGACTVHVDGEATFSCLTPIGAVEEAQVTTIEGLAEEQGDALQRAWIAEQVPQCGYCQSGQIMRAAALLRETPDPSREDIVEGMSTNLCRCGTYNRIVSAVQRAAKEV